MTRCEGKWFTFALEVLQQNRICRETFTAAIRDLLHQGRSKFLDMICGLANLAKTFMLNPLNSVYTTFCNPAYTLFAWVGAEDAKCIFLNDIRWSSQLIPWHAFLLMLGGQMVHLPAQKLIMLKILSLTKTHRYFVQVNSPFYLLRIVS